MHMDITVQGKWPSTITWNDPKPIVYSDVLTKRQLNAKCDRKGVLTYDPTIGTMLSAGRHILTAHFIPDEPDVYQESSASVCIDISKVELRVEWERPFFIYIENPLPSSSLKCVCVNDPMASIVYDPAPGTLLDVGWHTLHAVVTTSDPVNFFEKTEISVNQEVKEKSMTSIAWATPQPIVYPACLTRVQLNAYVGGAFPGTMEYDPPLNTVLCAGDHVLSVKFHPIEPSRRTSTQTVILTVLPGIARLIWNRPHPIMDGTALGFGVLNCTCSNISEGIFEYSPNHGEVLLMGKHDLRVTFHPTSSNYCSN